MDCGHRSLCRARRANDLLGRFCSLLTLTPYAQWRRHHAKHHGAWNDLDRRNAHGRDIYSSCLTVAEYNALGTWRRQLHRTAKHPAISLLVLPPLIFLVLYRFPFAAPRTWRAERRSVHLTNLSLVALHGALAAMLGVGPVAAVLLAVIVPASIVGVWLFSLQHHFDGTHWARHAHWDPVDAALRGSSFLRLPRLLQWVTGNIGFHHIHHASPRVPNYRLEACHSAHPGFTVASVLTLADGLRASRHALWDEGRGRMVTFAEANSIPNAISVVATRHRDGPRRNSPSIIEALHRDDRIGPAECEGIATPLIALLVAMHAGLVFGWWPLLALGVPAAALTVRTFIIQQARRRIHGRLLLAHWGSIVLAGEDRVPHIAAAEGGDYADDRFGGEATPDQAAAMGAELTDTGRKVPIRF